MRTLSERTGNRQLWWVLPIWFVVVLPAWFFIDGSIDTSLIWFAVEFALLASGTLILSNVAGHAVGRLLFVAGALFSLGVPVFATVEIFEEVLSEIAVAMGRAAGDALITVWGPLTVAAIALFPTGRWPTPRWRYPGALVWLSVGLAILAPMVNGGFGGDNSEGDATPWAASVAPLGDILSNLFFVSVLAVAVLASASVTYRFVRSDGVERQQMKWFAFSVAVLALGFVLDQALLGLNTAEGWRAVWIGLLVIQALAVMAIAIVRYRIYDIDRLISRTVAYVLVIGALALFFFVVVTGIGSLLPSQNSLAVAASTLAVAALFNPLRIRVQRWVDRRFNRARYDAQKVVDDYTAGLQDETDLSDLTQGLTGVVEQTLQPAATGLWVRDI